MKILTITKIDMARNRNCVQEFVKDLLNEAGFDMSKPITQNVNEVSGEYIFYQKEDKEEK